MICVVCYIIYYLVLVCHVSTCVWVIGKGCTVRGQNILKRISSSTYACFECFESTAKCARVTQVCMCDVDEDNCKRRTNWLTSLCRQATSQASHGHPLHMHPLDALIDVSTLLERTKEGLQTVLVTGAESGSRTMRMWWWSVSRVFSWRSDCSFSSKNLSLELQFLFPTEHDWIGANTSSQEQSNDITRVDLGSRPAKVQGNLENKAKRLMFPHIVEEVFEESWGNTIGFLNIYFYRYVFNGCHYHFVSYLHIFKSHFFHLKKGAQFWYKKST